VQVPPFKRFPQGRATFADGDDLGREAHHLCAWCTYGTLLIILFEHAGQAVATAPTKLYCHVPKTAGKARLGR
jgi:hypothetical protein